MLKTLLSFLFVLLVLNSKAHPVSDTAKTRIAAKKDIYTAVEIVPEFPGGMYEFSNFLARNIRYPALAREKNIQGRVFVTFIVEADGTLSDIKILKGIGGGCDEEVLRIMKQSPKWKPGYQNNKPVAVQFNMPIGFFLDRGGRTGRGFYEVPKKEKIKLPINDTLVQYYKYPDRMVYNKDNADYIAFIYPPDKEHKKQHPFKQYFANGKMKLNGYISERNGDLFLQGQCVEYYPHGFKRSIVTYNAGGMRTGSEYLFYPNGKLHFERQHDPKDNRQQIRYMTCNDSLGNNLARGGNGHWVEYDDLYIKEALSGPIKDGLPHGDWTIWKNDSTKTITNYEYGIKKSETPYFKVEGQFLSINELPMYKGSYIALNQYLRKNTKLPKKAYENNKLGFVLVAVTVLPDGKFLNVEVERALGFDCDEEAIRVIRSTEPWVSNTLLKNPLKIYFPVNFRYAGDVSDSFDFPPSLSVD